jgi:hypothetical protein
MSNKKTLQSVAAELLARAKALPPMTVREAAHQAADWAYGNLACSSNHKPNREAFRKLLSERGWTDNEFDEWANDKMWWQLAVLVPQRRVHL